ncbi:MAG: ATP-binding cassette domain-containing protein [Treponema sp.]|nr:ATP-binding cassette domain-containing protein [Treponema sp.]
MSGNSLSIVGLSIIRGEKELYHNFFLEAASEKVTCIIAPSGSGKTTLLDYVAGIPLEHAEVHGQIFFAGKTERPAVSFLFQEPRLIPSADILHNVMFPLVNVMSREKAEKRARLFLDRVQLSEKCTSLPDELSGGEKQRASMARGFAYPSKLLLMDEPFQSQDLRIKLHLIETLRQLLSSEKRTVLFVTHDVQEAVSLSDRIVVMDGSPLKVVLDENQVKTEDKAFEERVTSFVCGTEIL